MGLVRIVAALIGGTLLLNFMDATLQGVLVYALADQTPTDDASFLAVRDTPLVSGVFVVTHVCAAALVGYIIAKAAGAHEIRLAAVAGVLLTAQYLVALLGSTGRLPPGWVVPAMLLLTPPALIAGAYVRAEAGAIQSEQAGTARPKERS